MHEIIFTEKAKKEFLKIEKKLQERIALALERIRIKPERYVTKLVGDQAYRLRIGDYRVLMDIDNQRVIILILKVGHRRNVYD